MTWRIERLADHHQRAGFDCGQAVLNAFLQRQAGQLSRKGFGKTYVAVAQNGLTVVGFVTVSAGQVQTVQLPTQRKLPRYPVPVMRVGRLAVATSAQGQGIGRRLMAFALQLALDMAQQVGLYAVIVDAKNDAAKAFYEALGFTPTLDNPLCLYLPMATLQQLNTSSHSA